jgi:hypothetical protein
MKRVFVLAFLPLVLFGLETVNLIKDAGFEKDNEMWLMDSYASWDDDSTVIDSHDPDSSYTGEYCGSIDTRTQPLNNPPDFYAETGMLYQVFTHPKRLEDLDSVRLFHMATFTQDGMETSTWRYGLRLAFHNPSNDDYIEAQYSWFASDLDPSGDTPTRKTFPDTIKDEGVWRDLKRDPEADFVGIKGLPGNIELDSFVLYGNGFYLSNWRGQKAFFDGIRLMGYADYDVGVKEILSPEVISQGESYTPVARIKNFGREPADSFLVIVEADDGRTDTLPWALPPDTEDTVTFATWEWPEIPQYFTVRTVMNPDESDADDELVQGITVGGIQEPTLQDNRTNLQVISSRDGVLKVSFGIPDQQVGTLTLYDATGRRIERMAVTRSGSVEFDSALASGVYIVRLECGSSNAARKAVVLR